MPDSMEFESGLQEVTGSIHGESSKRKREEDSSAETRRTGKRTNSANVDTDHTGVGAVEALQEHLMHDGQNGGDHVEASNTAQAALNVFPTMSIPQATEVSFASQPDGRGDASYMDTSQADDSFMDNSEARAARGSGSKPAVGSEEWHKVRKDNHKEVERRRRETINEGINEIAKIVPGCEKNKGSILQRAVAFITQLKENEEQNIEKWTLEKLLTEQAIAELSASNDKLKAECERAWREVETWKKTVQGMGLAPKKEKGGTADN